MNYIFRIAETGSGEFVVVYAQNPFSNGEDEFKAFQKAFEKGQFVDSGRFYSAREGAELHLAECVAAQNEETARRTLTAKRKILKGYV